MLFNGTRVVTEKNFCRIVFTKGGRGYGKLLLYKKPVEYETCCNFMYALTLLIGAYVHLNIKFQIL